MILGLELLEFSIAYNIKQVNHDELSNLECKNVVLTRVSA
jgi:hypothetical protein